MRGDVSPMPDTPLDRWVQRTTLVALVALAVALVATGVRLYGGDARADILQGLESRLGATTAAAVGTQD